jgi:hypothetical protein
MVVRSLKQQLNEERAGVHLAHLEGRTRLNLIVPRKTDSAADDTQPPQSSSDDSSESDDDIPIASSATAIATEASSTEAQQRFEEEELAAKRARRPLAECEPRGMAKSLLMSREMSADTYVQYIDDIIIYLSACVCV